MTRINFKNEEIERKYQLLQMKFQKTYKEFKAGEFTDDRRIFCNIFEALQETLLVEDSFYNVNTNLDVWFNEGYAKEVEILKEIQTRFIELSEFLK